jgi:hypothetical protein
VAVGNAVAIHKRLIGIGTGGSRRVLALRVDTGLVRMNPDRSQDTETHREDSDPH